MNIDTEELRRLAEAATPGPWTHRLDGLPELNNQKDIIETLSMSHCPLTEELSPDLISYGMPSGADALFIAAANPAMVLGLLDEITRLTDLLASRDREAERYRWLRTPPNNISMAVYGPTGGLLRRDTYLDAAIDAAIAAEKGKT